MTYQELLQKALEMDKLRTEKNVLLSNARISAFLMDNCELSLPDTACFFVETNLKMFQGRVLRLVLDQRTAALPKYRTTENQQAIDSKAYYGSQDLGHTAPDWESIFRLGLGGQKIAQAPALVFHQQGIGGFCHGKKAQVLEHPAVLGLGV